MKKILIIGSKGYLGSRLTDYLLSHGYHCVGADIGFFQYGVLYYPMNVPTLNIEAKNITETIKANFQPLVYLEKAESQLSKVNSDLSGPRKYLVTAEILKQDGLKTIENVQRYITEISKKVSKSGRKR